MSLTESNSVLEVGDDAPEFELENYEGQNVSLNDLENYDGVLAIFMCNHCPYVQTQTEELSKLNDEFQSIAIVGINANSETHPMDSVDKMKDFVEENELASEHFYYLVDKTQDVAKSYGAECTPDPFLLDWRHKIYYKGRLNDKSGPNDEVEERDMKNAIEAMLKRKEPPKNQKPSQGCNIKWQE